jgi:hypothetical protein
MLLLAGKASTRRRPVNSALGRTSAHATVQAKPLAPWPRFPACFAQAGLVLSPSVATLAAFACPRTPGRHHRALRASIRQLRLEPSPGQSWLALRAGVLRRAVSSRARRLRCSWSACIAPCRRRFEPPPRHAHRRGISQLSLGQAAIHRPSVQLPASQGAAQHVGQPDPPRHAALAAKRSLSILRLAARAPCRSGRVTSTLGSTWVRQESRCFLHLGTKALLPPVSRMATQPARHCRESVPRGPPSSSAVQPSGRPSLLRGGLTLLHLRPALPMPQGAA